MTTASIPNESAVSAMLETFCDFCDFCVRLFLFSYCEFVGYFFLVSSVEVDGDVLAADIQLEGPLRTGVGVLTDARTVLIEEGRLVLPVGILRLLHSFLTQHTIILGALGADGVFLLLLGSPDAAHGHLSDASPIAIPVHEVGTMGVPAQHNGVALGKGLTEMVAGLCLLLGGSSVEDPTAAAVVGGEARTGGHDKGVTCPLGIVQEAVYLLVVGMIEIYDNKGVVTYIKAKGGLGDGLAQLFRHTGWHEGVIGLERICAAYIVVAHYGDERQTA